MNNNALTAMTGGITRIHNTPITEIEGSPAPQKRPALAAPTPSVTVSLSEDVLGENSKAQQITEKFEHTVRELYSPEATSAVNDKNQQTENKTQTLLEMAPLSLPTKADVIAFEQLFSDELAKAGVDVSIPIKLNITSEGEVKVSNDHPDKEKIEALFKDNSDLQQGFVKTETYGTLQKLYQLHQQWQQKIEGGASEESANNWLINTTKSTLASSQVSFQNGKISQSFNGGNAYS
ncbi:hypothetical protein A9R00_03190 [Oleispira antarctica]|uniref:Uncharacterized protein n=1 Tax=Oleispira antarctica TaxID=188908 RepID=A0A1Y5HUK1_OLEAN|nr:hypothetical protein A9R00_03190 [Oleispira antarctica]